MRIFKIIIPVLVLSLFLSLATPVFASSDNSTNEQHWGKVSIIRGEVKGVTDKGITIGDKNVQVSDKTKYNIPTVKQASLADIKVGMQAVAVVIDQNGTLVARQIMVIPAKVIVKHYIGEVTYFSYDPTTGGNITIQNKDNNSFTLVILAGKFTVLPKGATVNVGDNVTVIGHNDSVQNSLVATGVVISQPKPGRPEKIKGTVTLDTTADTLTIGMTVIKYDDKTDFMLRSVPGVQSGQQVTIVYHEVDNNLIAIRVTLGTDLPEVQAQTNQTE